MSIRESFAATRQLADFIGLTKKQIYAAATSALNRSAVTARAEAVRIVREREKKVRSSAAKAQIAIVKASPRQGDRLAAKLKLTEGVSLLSAAKVRQVTVIAYAGRKVVPIFQGKGKPPIFRMVDGQRKGVIVQGIDVSDKSFQAKMRNGKSDVFVRKGDARLPIKKLSAKGPINAAFFEEPQVRTRIQAAFADAFRKNFDGELDRRKQGNRNKSAEEALSAVFGD